MSNPYEDLKRQPETFEAALKESGLSIDCEFVPFSKSRWAKETSDPSQSFICWRVTISHPDRPGKSFTIDYHHGFGRFVLNGYVGYNEAAREATENGRYFHKGSSYLKKKLPQPLAADVMSCLLADCSALDYNKFEDWAEDLGYNPDSREAERTYNQCRAEGINLIELLGAGEVERLRREAEGY